MTESAFPCLERADGRRFPLGRRLSTIGTDIDCQIRLDDPQVKPQHAFLVFQMGSWKIRRLEVSAALRVEDRDVREDAELHHGTRIEVGGSKFAFLERETDSASESVEDFSDPVAALLHSVAAILRETETGKVLADMAQASARLLSSDAVRILYRAEGEGLWRTLAACPAGAPSSRFSASALRRAESARAAVLLGENDLGQLPPGESVELNGIRSILCAPLSLPDGGEGFLYADRLAGHPPFAESDKSTFDGLRSVFSEMAAQAARRDRQRRAIQDLQQSVTREAGATSILHSSPAMVALLHEATRVAASEVPVHVHGETGTGKELLARFLHDSSRRSNGAFVAINCGAIPENLMESELFGHEKGAFTGASAKKEGWVEKANGGTLFLDELGELPLGLQVKMLRVLQQGELVRVGGSEPIKVDFRLVTATNRNLKDEVAAGRFRADLYYRVAVVPLELPPLRDRGQDAVLLATHFCRKFSGQYGAGERTLSRAAEKAILEHSWPGNIRELENAVQKAVILCDSDRIRPKDLGLADDLDDLPEAPTGVASTSLYAIRDRAEADAIRDALAKSGGNVSHCSRILEVDRKVLIRTIERLGIRAEDFK